VLGILDLSSLKKFFHGWVWWLTAVISATCKIELRSTVIQVESRQKVKRSHFDK
jgi:hypothetical protein